MSKKPMGLKVLVLLLLLQLAFEDIIGLAAIILTQSMRLCHRRSIWVLSSVLPPSQ